VSYTERNPCRKPYSDNLLAGTGSATPGHDLTIEVTLHAADYDGTVLTTVEAARLDVWLREHGFPVRSRLEESLPKGAGGANHYLVVTPHPGSANVEGGARLTALSFSFDGDVASAPLPFVLFPSNVDEPQDLTLDVLHPSDRFEVVGYPHAFIPTDLDVDASLERGPFGAFYDALLEATWAHTGPNAFVTVFATTFSYDRTHFSVDGPWDLPQGLVSVLRALGETPDPKKARWVLTRLRARLTGAVPLDELVLRAGWAAAKSSEFQSRYTVQHPYRGMVSCKAPQYSQWIFTSETAAVPSLLTVSRLSRKKGTMRLESFLRGPVPELDLAGPKRRQMRAPSKPR